MQKLLLSTLALGALADDPTVGDRGMSGWSVNCRTDTNGGEYGPAFLDSSRLFNQELDLIWSSFGRGDAGIYGNGPFGDNGDIGADACALAKNDTSNTIVKASYLGWPNEIGPVPPSVFGDNGYLAIPNGFAVPGVNDGCIAIADVEQYLSTGETLTDDDLYILTDGCGQGRIGYTRWYYHVARWFDMDNDGDLDLLTSRASSFSNPTNVSQSQLVWFQNPGTQNFEPSSTGAKAWKSFVVNAGNNIADTYLDVMRQGDNIIVITGGFASRTLAIVQGPEDWSKNKGISATVIDNDGYYFNQEFGDLDLDGVPDVLVTIGSYGEQEGKLIVYKGAFTYKQGNNVYSLSQKTVVYDQFPVFNSKGLGSPGEATTFSYTNVVSNKTQPSIMVSGDDDGNMYMFDPASATFGDYTFNQIYQSSAFNPFVTPFNAPTVGRPAVVDVNEDGCNEIVVANYHNKQVVILEQNSLTKCKRRPPGPSN